MRRQAVVRELKAVPAISGAVVPARGAARGWRSGMWKRGIPASGKRWEPKGTLPARRSAPAPWAVVLAAGDGTRLLPLTRRLHGEGVPKQFAMIDGERSLLQTTMNRLAARFPPERTVVVVGRPHEALGREQLRAYRGVDVVVQPANLGTGPGLLLPLARIRARDPGARVAVFPSDHHVARPERLLGGVDRALAAPEGSGPVMIGIEADHPETEYGWIVRDRDAHPDGTGIRAVRRFVEKPNLNFARRLLREGALWSAFICTGRLANLWDEARLHLPRLVRAFDAYVKSVGRPEEADLLERIYRELEPSDFSRDVLQKAQRLGVVPVRDSGWSDWGTPRRIFESLRATPDRRRLLQRLTGPAHPWPEEALPALREALAG